MGPLHAGRCRLFCRQDRKEQESNPANDHNVLGTILPVHPMRPRLG